MTVKAIGATLALGVLASLSASCSQPTTQATPQPQTEAGQPGASAPASMQTVAQTASPAAQAPASAAGAYEGDFDGAGALVTISGSPPHYSVHIIVGGDGCSGGALGPASANSSGVLTVRPTDPAAGACTIAMTPTAHGYSLAESGCSNLHGDTCGFSGDVRRKH